jgi:hypothetical protein
MTEVHVAAADLESAVVWYATHLGWDVVDYQPRHARLRLPAGGHLVLWARAATAVAPAMVDGGHCAALRLRAQDLTTLSAYLHASQCAMQQEINQTTGRQTLRLDDPSGNLLLIEEELAAELGSCPVATAVPAPTEVHPGRRREEEVDAVRHNSGGPLRSTGRATLPQARAA